MKANAPIMVRAIVFSGALLLGTFAASGQDTANPTAVNPPAKVEQLLELLNDPAVKSWLEARPAAAAEPQPADDFASGMEAGEAALRNRINGLRSAVPRLPQELAAASAIAARDIQGGRPGTVIAILAVLVAVGAGAEWLFRRWLGIGSAAAAAEGEIAERPVKLLSEFIPLVVFALASAGLFLMFEWPPLLRLFVLTFLSAVIAFRVVRTVKRRAAQAAPILSRFGGAPAALDDRQATFWFIRVQAFAGIFLFGWALVSLMPHLGFSVEVRAAGRLCARTGPAGDRHRDRLAPAGPGRTAFCVPRLADDLFPGPAVVSVGGRLQWPSVDRHLRPHPAADRARRRPSRRSAGRSGQSGEPQHDTGRRPSGARRAHCCDRPGRRLAGLRFSRDSRAAVRGSSASWRASCTASSSFSSPTSCGSFPRPPSSIGCRRAGHGESADEIARSGRLRTLLPIFRNALAVFIGVVAVLTILSGLGVQIMPLIAGAGIFGVAIGFGSQTLVKDVLSGVFYMLDDAFRVGEYIQSGSYKGTVESFSLRSVRLRHHRGPVFTVPFGDLGAVQNMSRDWVMEKIVMTVTYNSDVELARKLIKKIGQELAEDPEFKASTIQPLKMQGVDSFGESGIVLRMKLMTKPGEQFGIKRKAFVMIKKAFDDNGIKLAVPTVQVSGGEDHAPAVALDAVRRRTKAAKEQAAAAGEVG